MSTTTPTKYYTLIAQMRFTKTWAIQFGSFDKVDVTAEMQEYKDKKSLFGKESEYIAFQIIITATYMTAEIQPIVDALNGEAQSA